jgi:hypothetical protein
MVQAELQNGRWAMLGVSGILFTSVRLLLARLLAQAWHTWSKRIHLKQSFVLSAMYGHLLPWLVWNQLVCLLL